MKKTLNKSQVIRVIETNDDIDKAAEEIDVAVNYFRDICEAFNIDISTIYDKLHMYYFTFGSIHVTKKGYPMQDHWVQVVAQDYGKAREIFITYFTTQFMLGADKFAFQYKDFDFVPTTRYFPKGQAAIFLQDGEGVTCSIINDITQ